MSDGDGESWRERLPDELTDRMPSLSRKQQNQLLVAVVALVLMVAPVVALVDSVRVRSGVPVGAQNGPVIMFEDPSDGQVNLRDPWVNETTISYNSSAGNLTAHSDGYTNATVNGLNRQEMYASEIHTPKNRTLTLKPGHIQNVKISGNIRELGWGDKASVEANDGNRDFFYSSYLNGGNVTIGGLPANQSFSARTGSGESIPTFQTNAQGRATLDLPENLGQTAVFIGDSSAPVIIDPQPADGATVEAPDTTLSATIDDADFASGNESVTVEFYLNGEVIQTTTIMESKTVEADMQPPLGQQSTWKIVATDSFGNSSELPQRTFTVPATLKIYDERNPSQLIDDPSLNVTVTFHPLDSENATAERRTAENGSINLSGLPADERFTVTVGTSNQTTSDYVFRRVVVDSLYATNRIYVLNRTGDNSQVVFELQDPTGQFPPSETVLFVEKPITVNNDTSYQTIAGDVFGASSQFPVILANDARYRLRVQTLDDNNERILGAYNVYGDAREPLKIDRIEPSSEDRDTSVVYGGLEGQGNATQLAVRHRGGTNNTTVEYTVYDGDGNVVVPETSTTASSFAHIYPANESKTYRVNYTVTNEDGTSVSNSWTAGRIAGIADRLTMDGQALSIISWVLILSTMGLIVILDPRLAPAGGTGMATALSIIGTVAIPGPLLGVAGAVSVLTLFGGNQ